MSIEFEISGVIPATPDAVYAAWLNSDGHAKMTGSPAVASREVGAAFAAWDGYIQGRNLELEPPRRLLQSWRTSEFEESDEDSLLEVLLERVANGTRVTIRHSRLPDHGMQYKQGWVDAYLTPMVAYFGGEPAKEPHS